MEKIRIGNDIDILWSITAVSSGTEFPYDLSGRSLTLYLKNAFGKEEIKDYTIEGGSLRFRYYGKDQKKAGRYSLILVENAGMEGMQTVDECDAFELVQCSCEAGGEKESAVEIATLHLESKMSVGPVGPQGERGPQGVQGPQGPEGPSYDDTAIKNQLTELSEEIIDVRGGEKEMSVTWQSINSRTWYFNIDLAQTDNVIKVAWSDNEYTVKTKGLNADGSESGYGANPWYWLEGCPQTGLNAAYRVDGYVIIDKAAILASHPTTTTMQIVVRVGDSHDSITAADCEKTFKVTEQINGLLTEKVNKEELATINGLPLYKGGNIEIGGQSNDVKKEKILPTWQSINSRTWYFLIGINDFESLSIKWSDNEYTTKVKGVDDSNAETGYGAEDWYWLDGTPHTGLDVKDKVDGYLSFNSADILAAYPNTTKLQVIARVGTSHNSITSDDCNNTYDIEKLSFKSAKMYNDIIVKVGKNGDFTSISAALTYLSQYYPLYKYGGVKAEICIMSGTIINEQILVVGADYSWITITYEDYQPNALVYDEVAEKIAKGEIVYDTTSGYNSVKVDASRWSRNGITHDTRGDLCLFRAEDGGRLPAIGCVFKLQVENAYGVAGICCNRGSSCVVKTLCGFIGFKDGVISNNESSITIREGITMNCARWGCHARHNGEVSARSVIAVGCASNPAFASEYAALCSNRIADLDGREAWVSAGTIAFRIEHCSRMNCNGTNIIGDETTTIYATAAAVGNFYEMACTCPIAINYSLGSSLVLGTYDIEGSYTYNAVSKNGILYR